MAFGPVDSTLARSEQRKTREQQLDQLLIGVLSSKGALRQEDNWDTVVREVGEQLIEKAPYIHERFAKRVREKMSRFGNDANLRPEIEEMN